MGWGKSDWGGSKSKASNWGSTKRSSSGWGGSFGSSVLKAGRWAFSTGAKVGFLSGGGLSNTLKSGANFAKGALSNFKL